MALPTMEEAPDVLHAGFFDIDELNRGNPMALAVAYRILQPAIQYSSYRLCGEDRKGEKASKSITEKTFEDMWRRREGLEDRYAVGTTLFVNAKNTAYKFYKSKDRNPDDKEWQPKRTVAEICKPLYDLADKILDDDQKKMFVASYKAFADEDDIAIDFRMPVEDVRKKQFQIIHKMNAAWTKHSMAA